MVTDWVVSPRMVWRFDHPLSRDPRLRAHVKSAIAPAQPVADSRNAAVSTSIWSSLLKTESEIRRPLSP
jgi:hypothetical protein